MTVVTAFPFGRSPKGKETVSLRRVTRDRHGDEIVTDTLVTFKGCAVLPRVLGEDNDRGSLAIPGYTVFIPPANYVWASEVSAPDQTVYHTDQLLVRGKWLGIEGEVQVYVDLKGKLKGTFATTKGEAQT